MSSDAPPVLMWYRIYAGLMAAMYVVVTLVGVSLPMWMPPGGAEDPPPWLFALIFGCIGAPFSGAYIAAFFLPRRPWVWIYHLVLICIGLTSACCMMASIPLLIFWIKPET